MRNKQILKELIIYSIILFAIAAGMNYRDIIKKEQLAEAQRIEELKRIKAIELAAKKGVKLDPKISGAVNIPYITPKKLSFIDTSELLNKRKLAVEKSPLKPKFYSPSKDIFSKYDNSRPFFLEHGSGIYEVVVTEPIENPMILVGLNNSLQFIDKLPDYFYDNEICMPEKRSIVDILQSHVDQFGCQILNYPDKNMIEVFYPMHSFDIYYLNKYVNKYPYFYTLTGLNAKDLGYKYMKTGAYLNIDWRDKGVVRDYEKYEFKDYIGVERFSPFYGGVNNNKILPHQPELDFRITKLPASIEMTLYKKEDDIKGLKYIINFVDKNYFKNQEFIDNDIKRGNFEEQTKNMSYKQKQEFIYDHLKETFCEKF